MAEDENEQQALHRYFDESADVNRMCGTGAIVARLPEVVLATQTKTAAKIESDDTD